MQCPRCRRPNRDPARFCTGCGAPLALADEPDPRPLDVTIPLDRRQARATPPPVPGGSPPQVAGPARGAAPDVAFAPVSAVERSHWDLALGTGAAADVPAPAGPAAPFEDPGWLAPPGGPSRAAPRAPPAVPPRPVAPPAVPGRGAPVPRAAPSILAPPLPTAPAQADASPAATLRPQPAPRPAGSRVDPPEWTAPELPRTAGVDVDAGPVEVRLERAPGWMRGLAWALDGIPFAAGGVFLARSLLAGSTAPDDLGSALDLLSRDRAVLVPLAAFLVLLAAVYATLAHALMGATLGKRVLGLRVVARNGTRPTLARAATRSAVALVSGALLGLGFLLAFFTRSGRALHDLVAGTYVVRSP